MNDWKNKKRPGKPAPNKGRGKGPKASSAKAEGDEKYWLYGLHPVRAALDNHARDYHQLLTTQNGAKNLGEIPVEPQIVDRKAIDRLVTRDAVHQGVALEVTPLRDIDLWDIVTDDAATCLVVLDQVTDPHNVGAVMRSAAALGASAVITTWRHSPPETAVLAKASAGMLEIMPYIRGRNLADQLEQIKEAGFTIIGLDGAGDVTPRDLSPRPEKVALVLGAEGKGLRQRTASLCDHLMRLPIDERVESLNVSNAAAVALYALTEGLAGN